ncbi:MAG TPA: hypothetical protein VK253_05165 [Candidatus Binatia bacterium]|nr:hypothetical protein [Candidatus Binatia bacterium]
MTLFNNPVALIITMSLIVQIVVLSLLITGYILKRKLRFRLHGMVMATAVILHLSMISYVMIPSFALAVIKENIIPAPLGMISIVSIIHVILGATGASLGVWIVVSWRFKKNIQGCIRRKKYMLKTLTVWVAALTFGIMLYALFIGPLLTS